MTIPDEERNEGQTAPEPPEGSEREPEATLGENDGSADQSAVSGVEQAIIETFEAEVAEARRQADENWDRYLRAEAELDNVRKRAERQRQAAMAQQRRELLMSLLEVMDNLERALSFGESDAQALLEGVETTYRELSRGLAREGVAAVQALNEPFDPALHEATGVVPLPEAEEELVVAVDRPGYTLDGELLRPARVVVGKPIDGQTEEAEEGEAD